MGNNEVVGPYGPGTVLTPVLSNLHLIRLQIRLHAMKMGQLIEALLGRQTLGEGGPQIWRGMEMFLGQQVRADDPRLQTTYSHFRRNLEDICRIAAGRGVPTILCTVGVNLRDCPPFASLHRPDLTAEQLRNWDAAYKQGLIAEMQGKYDEAAVSYVQAALIDDSYAELQFRLGYCYELAGDYEKASERYIKARDLDTLRFRADTRINEIIRAVADRRKSQGVWLADVAKAVEADAPHGLPGETSFYEHVHLTFRGNYLLARTALEQIEPRIAAKFAQQGQARGPTPTLEQCAERLGFNDWSRQETLGMVVTGFLAKPPFTNQLRHKEQMDRLTKQLEAWQAALTPEVLQSIGETYRATIAKAPDDWRLRWDYGQMLAEDLKQYDAAHRAVSDRAETSAALAHAARFARGGAPHEGRPDGRDRRVREAPGDQADLRLGLLLHGLVSPEAGQGGPRGGLPPPGDPARAGPHARLRRPGRGALQGQAASRGREGLPGGPVRRTRITRNFTATWACC